ncbi:trypsin-like serine protease [Vibrio sp. JC009]|uniref:S1 family peptidase n=1 Tax=Vibrio sp. JC009 TaxID=2912314 RepID=UPI0023AE94DE|nr:trypsin-like serine protease [Vibrio sp. JC009]WED24540.1 trypsin-like serine protease [Vibrio sp. JC009]
MNKVSIPLLIATTSLTFSSLSTAEEAQAYIVNGSDTTASSYPTFASLIKWQDYNSGYVSYGNYCGSTILKANYVLTAAHCVYIDSTDDEERMLFTNVYPQLEDESWSNISSSSTEKIRISEVYYPDTYNGSLYHDVAILKLEQSMSVTDEAELPADNDDATYRSSSYTFYAVGHGYTSKGTDGSTSLQDVALTWVPNSSCNYTITTDYNLCMEGTVTYNSEAGENLEGSVCDGDSGGPLYWTDGSTQKLVGVTSYGPASKCGDPSYSATSVFSEVLDFKTWINNVTSGAVTAKYTFTETERQAFRDGDYSYKYTSGTSSVSSSGSSGGSVPLWAFPLLIAGFILRRR